jgi:hypothetical protein
MGPRDFLRQKVWTPVRAVLTQGLTPHKLTLSVVLGASVGVIPFPGISTIIVGAAAALLRLNQPAIQLANYAVSMGQLLLFLPFVRAGEWLFDAGKLPFNALKLLEMLRQDPVGTVAQFGGTLVHAVAAWGAITPPVAVVLYFVLKPLLARVTARYAAR